MSHPLIRIEHSIIPETKGNETVFRVASLLLAATYSEKKKTVAVDT